MKKNTRNKTENKSPHDEHNQRLCRIFLILIAFFSGSSIMILELTGNRILAPWFGNSLYTWTGLIGVILVSISCGYYLGGFLADKYPDYIILAHLLAVSALLTILVPLLYPMLEGEINSMNIVWGPVIATIWLFAFPSCVLAAVSPFAIRLISLLSHDTQVGISAGYIGMFSTLGSVGGTFFTGFWLIPHVRLKMIFLITGIGLAICSSAGYMLFAPLYMRKNWLFILLCLICGPLAVILVFSPQHMSSAVLFEKTTFYHRIRVTEKIHATGKSLRSLYLDSTRDGAQFSHSCELPLAYQNYWELAKAFCPQLNTAAFLGGGGFAMPEALHEAFPEAQIDVIELDPMVIEVGRRYFRIDEYPRMNVVAQDARRFLYNTDQLYDLIFGDVYHGVQYIPAHLVTVEFFNLVKNRLTEKGVYMMNLISSVQGKKSTLLHALTHALSQVFDHVLVFVTHPKALHKSQNIIFVAAGHELKIQSITNCPNISENRKNKFIGGYLNSSSYENPQCILLTDEYNPVEYIAAQSQRREKRVR